MKRLVIVFLFLFLLTGCREEGIIIETMTPSPPTSVTEPSDGTVPPTVTDTAAPTETTEATQATTLPAGSGAYVLNTGSGKFHLQSCGSVATIKPENRRDTNATRYELMAEGYAPCGKCNP